MFRINTENSNAAQKAADSLRSFCAGEDQSLTEDEVVGINHCLAQAASFLQSAQLLMEEGRKRFAEKQLVLSRLGNARKIVFHSFGDQDFEGVYKGKKKGAHVVSYIVPGLVEPLTAYLTQHELGKRITQTGELLSPAQSAFLAGISNVNPSGVSQ